MKYKQINLLSKIEVIVEFNVVHHWCFADNYNVNTQIREAPSLIRKWNLQQPLYWKYELLEDVEICNIP